MTSKYMFSSQSIAAIHSGAASRKQLAETLDPGPVGMQNACFSYLIRLFVRDERLSL
jgi:hypothetical protein